MKHSAEVVIIGGGVVGTSIAYHLAGSGCRDVILLEKESLGSGSTGKCAGGIRHQFSTEVNIRLSVESVREFQRLEQETEGGIGLHQHGYLLLAATPQEWAAFQEARQLQRELGVEVHLLTPQQAREMVPGLSTGDILGAAFCPHDGYADPHSVTQAFASGARRRGVRVWEGTEATGIELKGGRVTAVHTSAGKVSTGTVVNAAGPYAALVGRLAGVDLPVHPCRRHILFTAPVDFVRRDCPVVVDFHTGFWFRPEGAGLMLGMRNPDEPSSLNTAVDWGFVPAIAGAARHRLPRLGDTGLVRVWAGSHADTPDYDAIVGPFPGVEGLILAVGFCGHGFMHSPATGRLVAELILHSGTSLDISALSPRRFLHPTPVHPGERGFI